jgi:hypothetical protein
LLRLLGDHPIFIGFKADPALRQKLETLSSSDRQYVSAEESSFLRLCMLGDDVYVGKIVHEILTTDRVDDIRRNVVSIIRKLGSDVRLPPHLKIVACSASEAGCVPVPAGVPVPVSV